MTAPRDGWGMLWVRDAPNQILLDIIDSGAKYFNIKYGFYPDYIECSFDDAQKKFDYNGMEVVPDHLFNKGVVWMTVVK